MITTRQSGGDAARAKTCGTDDLAPSIRAPSSRAWHGREQDGTRPHNVYTLCRVRRASVTHGYVAPTSLLFKAFLYDSRQDQWNQRPRWCPPPLPPPPPALLHLSLSLCLSLCPYLSPLLHISLSLCPYLSPLLHISLSVPIYLPFSTSLCLSLSPNPQISKCLSFFLCLSLFL